MALVGLLLGTAIAAAIFIWAPKFSRGPALVPAKTTAAPANATAPEASGQTDPQKLMGKWLRPDGGYVLDIQSVKGDRTLQVAYLNPNPIHVSRAEMDADGKQLRVFVELRDAGYPGCTYKLTYDSGKDQLTGIYFQAAMQESFDVVFTRLK
jgi:hypothetical protein